MNDHARVLFFATIRDRTGTREAIIEFPHGSTIVDIKQLVLQKYPGISEIMDTLILALNHEFAFDTDVIPNDAEIAFFPPVSGGMDDGADQKLVGIIDHEININLVITALSQKTTGAICFFTGIVRGITTRGGEHHTDRIEYEAYQQMAESKLLQIEKEIRSYWREVEGVALIQRIGQLSPGMVSVVVACSSSHRDSGIFEAARYGIDRIKEIVPVWKKEYSPDGEAWIEGEYFPHKGE